MNRLLLPLLLAVACGLPAAAQLKTTSIPTFSLKHKHFVDFKCDGQPDKVVGRRDERYFGCVNGKVACSDDGITQSMIATYERNRADFIAGARQRQREVRAKLGKRSGSHSTVASAAAYTIPSKSRPPAQTEPIKAGTVRQVAVGTSIDEVIATLGQPKWRIAGNTEKWTYSLTSGKSAKLTFEDGKLTTVVLP